MHPEATVESARLLAASGQGATEIARTLAVPRDTIRGWLRGTSRTRSRGAPSPASLDARAYAYLLGVYLGDGYIASRPSGSFQLRVFCDAAYPGIVREVVAAVAEVRAPGRVRTYAHGDGCLVVSSTWKHWPALLPQHGPGRKHERRLGLVDWQLHITRRLPQSLVRGLIHSDGCRFIARQRRRGRVYSYSRYQFSNRSGDILDILRTHLALLGIGWTEPNQTTIAIDRRADVAKLDAFVGSKC